MINILSDKQKIISYLKIKGISKNSFYKKTGLSIGFLDSGHSLGVDKLRIIIDNYPDFNYWDLLGLDTETSSSGYALAENRESTKSEINRQSRIPLVALTSVHSFQNPSFTIEKNTVIAQYVIPLFQDKQVDFMIEIKGTAMHPKFKSGDVLACRIIRDPKFIQWNRIYVLATKGQGILIKRLQRGSEGHFKMISDNKNFHPFEVPISEITSFAIIVGSIRLE